MIGGAAEGMELLKSDLTDHDGVPSMDSRSESIGLEVDETKRTAIGLGLIVHLCIFRRTAGFCNHCLKAIMWLPYHRFAT